MRWWMLTELTVVNTSQYIHISGHYVVYFKTIQHYQLYLNKTGGKLKNEIKLELWMYSLGNKIQDTGKKNSDESREDEVEPWATVNSEFL